MPDARKAPPCALVVFGASGDLTARKLLPAIDRLGAKGRLDERFTLIGVARTEMDDVDFQKRALQAVPGASPQYKEVVGRARYVVGDYAADETFTALCAVLDELALPEVVFYLATVPTVFAEIVEGLGRHGLTAGRVVIEKPYGRDLASAQQLDDCVHAVFAESHVYRIDHYLGKETVQNVLALRFANAIFEPIWNRRYVDHVQITVAEDIGVEHRGSFYETAGALRDIVQNHVMQVLALTAMEAPVSIDAQGIRDEKVKALRAVPIMSPDDVAARVVRAQYVGYTGEEGVAPDSQVETFMAMRLYIDNWRWAGVPFYVRTGKKLKARATEVALQFHDVPHLPFAAGHATGLGPNLLVLRIQPDEGITLRFGAKVPGQEFEVRSVSMDFTYSKEFAETPPDAYERLLLDAMVGDPTLFIRSDEVMQAWRIVQPILDAWDGDDTPIRRYRANTWGPAEAAAILADDHDQWHDPLTD
ncbi:MAG TPA: glucose-6-phosphate dehydrogenase [Acidimicrobiales bacterium]|nr:glucose-6-phosphate dehydrogenase [Acidimicrobiales bacterium]